MHEKAVCKEIIDICLQAKEDYHLEDIYSVTLKVGIHSCVHKGQLEYLFQIAKQETDLKNTRLLFEDEPYQVQCLDCSHIYQPSFDTLITCEKCHSERYRVVSGYDCFVDHIDGKPIQ